MALAAYRSILRAARLAFKDDAPILASAQTQARAQFQEKASLDPAGPDAKAAIQHAQDVAKILRENVVQGRKADGQENTYKLRIHEFTERGDNESIHTAGCGPAARGACGCQ
ncbi:hypothetical protein CDD81_3979 [Ophiocordyceps australis]|uniref:Mitochondrial zinc maintenance protein 1, mitochondrial n=1 Tax=Ophiocordyceps australis TaxID=1399860 RepID=A0A2C5XNX6_9HYPO|nr:hypothetical protein CDD81_3979 [Ophiocordyceps australis]